jgi:hypothetical protein
MDAHELNHVLSRCPTTRDRFHGVYARNTLPPVLDEGAYVVNTDVVSSPGIHWCAVWRNASCETERLDYDAEFWDSLGKGPHAYKIRLTGAADGPRLRVAFQDRRLQSPDSDVCGEFVCYFVFWRCLGATMSEISQTFTSDVKNNDNIVRSFKQSLLSAWT